MRLSLCVDVQGGIVARYRGHGGRAGRVCGFIGSYSENIFFVNRNTSMNAKPDMLDPDIPNRLQQHPVTSALGIKPTEEEITTAIKAMVNAKAVGPDGLPAELMEPDFQHDRTILLELHRLTTLIWREGKVPQQ